MKASRMGGDSPVLFLPHPDFRLTQYILDERETVPHNDSIEFGQDGKPFYVAGPYDNVDRIMKQLEAKAGKDGFHYLVPVPGDEYDEEYDDDLEDEEEYEDDEEK